MKTFKFKTVLLFLFCASLFISCSNNDDDDEASNGGDEYLTAKVAGVNFEASKDPATIIGATISNGILVVQGGDNNGNTVSFQIANYTGTGTYKTGDNLTNSNQILYLTINPVASWSSNLATAALGTLAPGTINVTLEDGNVVEGTFSFEGYNADTKTIKNITEGKFKAEIQ